MFTKQRRKLGHLARGTREVVIIRVFLLSLQPLRSVRASNLVSAGLSRWHKWPSANYQASEERHLYHPRIARGRRCPANQSEISSAEQKFAAESCNIHGSRDGSLIRNSSPDTAARWAACNLYRQRPLRR